MADPVELRFFWNTHDGDAEKVEVAFAPAGSIHRDTTEAIKAATRISLKKESAFHFSADHSLPSGLFHYLFLLDDEEWK